MDLDGKLWANILPVAMAHTIPERTAVECISLPLQTFLVTNLASCFQLGCISTESPWAT